MARTIFTVNATQVVISETHPEGAYSVISGYPKRFDSRQYDGDTEKALRLATSDFYSKWGELYGAENPNRVMATMTLERSDGRQLDHKSFGAFPAEPEPEEQDLQSEEPAE